MRVIGPFVLVIPQSIADGRVVEQEAGFIKSSSTIIDKLAAHSTDTSVVM